MKPARSFEVKQTRRAGRSLPGTLCRYSGRVVIDRVFVKRTWRSRAGLSRSELGERMETARSVVARLESGRARPSTRTLEKVAKATGTRLRIAFDPA